MRSDVGVRPTAAGTTTGPRETYGAPGLTRCSGLDGGPSTVEQRLLRGHPPERAAHCIQFVEDGGEAIGG